MSEVSVSERLNELGEILEEVKESDSISLDTRKRFWKLVRQIKREHDSNHEEIKVATEIRNIMFAERTANVYSLREYVIAATVLAFFFSVVYIYACSIPVLWFNIFSWTYFEIFVIIVRFFGIFLAIAFFYPYGRLIGGTLLGIKFDGMYFSHQKEPGLKIEYESFLKANPSNRKWFFFISGLWTFLTALSLGIIGFLLAGDFLGIIICILFLFFYGYVIGSGSPSNSGGEMGHYNREKKIEAAWKKKE